VKSQVWWLFFEFFNGFYVIFFVKYTSVSFVGLSVSKITQKGVHGFG